MTYTYSEKEGLKLIIRENGRNVEVDAPFKPYFFVKKKYQAVVQYYAKRKGIQVHITDTDYKSLEGDPVIKVEVNMPKSVSLLRDQLPLNVTYEADIPYVRRVMVDLDWRTSTAYRKLYYDIEVKDGKIVCIGVSGENGNVEIITGDEKSILENFLLFVEQYDMALGYNSSVYDVPVLKERFKQYKMQFPEMCRWYDLLPAFRDMSQRMLPSWGLEYVGKHIVGIERVHTNKQFSQLTMQEIYERCQRDVEIIVELDKKLNLSEIDIMKAHISYIFPDETGAISRCIDTLLLRKARELGFVLPNKPVAADVQKHSGAFVAQPPEPLRIYHNVLYLDCVSLYPNVIINFKISPDPERRLYPEVLSMLIQERKRLKKLYRETGNPQYYSMQYAYKILANAFYGVFNAPGFRVQRVDLGDEVARKGREIITTLIQFYSQLGFNVIYGDTDSVVLSDVPADENIFMMLADAGSAHIREVFGADIQVEPKKFYSKFYFPKRADGDIAAKKRYAGVMIWSIDDGWLTEPEIDAVGIEIVRSDFPPAAQQLQKELIEGFLNGRSIEELLNVLLSYKARLRNNSFTYDELALSKSITRKEYKVKAPHVKAAEKLSKAGMMVNVGDKIRYVQTLWGPQPVELCNDIPIDVEYYWEMFRKIAERTLGITDEVTLQRWLRG
jgi:DNA polymerase elongation subunit (family B)